MITTTLDRTALAKGDPDSWDKLWQDIKAQVLSIAKERKTTGEGNIKVNLYQGGVTGSVMSLTWVNSGSK